MRYLRTAWLPAADLMPIIRFAHMAKAFDIVPEVIALRAAKVVVVENMLNRGDRFVEFAFIELGVLPFPREGAELLFRAIEPIAIAIGGACFSLPV